MKDFPIPVTTTPEAVEALVNKILLTKSKDSKADVSKLEHQIDQLVYQLYELTPDEINLVEGQIGDNPSKV
jgi:type II restriction/modification system DNA methylase subunit YeeA